MHLPICTLAHRFQRDSSYFINSLIKSNKANSNFKKNLKFTKHIQQLIDDVECATGGEALGSSLVEIVGSTAASVQILLALTRRKVEGPHG